MVNEKNSQVIEPLVQMVVNETAHHRIETDAQYADRLREELYSSFEEFQKKVRLGIRTLTKNQTKIHGKTLKKMADSLLHSEKLGTGKGDIFQKMMHISDQEMCVFYQEGIDQFNQNFLNEASAVFFLLTLFNPRIASFWRALGMAEEKRGEKLEATKAYLIAAELDEKSAMPYLYAAECLIALHQEEQAKRVLIQALEKFQYQVVLENEKNKIENLLQSLK